MAAGILVVVSIGTSHFDAAQRIDNVFWEAVEVDLGIMEMGTPANFDTVSP